MNLVLYTHPAWMGLQSQTRVARMMAGAYQTRGHRVQVRQPTPRVHAWVVSSRWARWAKWAGYFDQFILFAREQRRAIAADPPDTLYVFCDQALGPWVPLAAHRPHVVHCHDLLALKSALGLVPENPTSWTGRVYQRYIRAGFRRARHFISVSEISRSDLHAFGAIEPVTSEVVYNGQNHPYRALPPALAWSRLQAAGLGAAHDGLLLHVGGGQWYKNTEGVLELYAQYVQRRLATGRPVLPLLMVSPTPGALLQSLVAAVPDPGRVRFVPGIDNDSLEALYSIASALLFPSLAEGFGWPIAEGLVCGCPVITTGEAPMSEVGGTHAHYLPRLASRADLPAWADKGAALLCEVLDRPDRERERSREAGIAWARRFDAAHAIERYLDIYSSVLASERSLAPTR